MEGDDEMMNKSEVDFCDFSWNPVTGCENDCAYCFARRQAQRFCGDIRLNKSSDQLQRAPEASLWTLEKPFKNDAGRTTPLPVGFEPTLHRYRLPMPEQKKKPANIFVCSMADLFGEWVPDEWISEVLVASAAAPWHNYLFLTKNPERYPRQSGTCRSSENIWFGTSITEPEDMVKITQLPEGFHRFVCFEPILDRMDAQELPELLRQVDWVIIGAETGQSRSKTTPRKDWITEIVDACRQNNIPVHLKASSEMTAVWGGDLIQERPEQLKHDEVVIPHCRECEHSRMTPQGKRGNRYDCEKTGRHIAGRYARTSPPWCPLRG